MDSNEYAGSQYWESTGTMLTGRLAGQKSAVYARRFRRVLEFICVIAMLVGSSYLINGLMIQEEYQLCLWKEKMTRIVWKWQDWKLLRVLKK